MQLGATRFSTSFLYNVFQYQAESAKTKRKVKNPRVPRVHKVTFTFNETENE